MALIQVRRGNEGIITVDEGLFDSIYKPAGFARVSSSSPSPTPSAPAAPAPASQPKVADSKPDMSSVPTGYVLVTPEQAKNKSAYEDVRNVSNNSGGSVNVVYYAYPIPKATVVNAQGQRVVVRTDGRFNPQNNVPTSQQMFDQGFRVEKSPGVPAEPFSTTKAQTQSQVSTQGTVDQRSNPSILLADGRLIRASDPQYSQYVSVPGSIQIDEATKKVVPSVNGNIQTFADGSQLNTSTGQPVRGSVDFSKIEGLGSGSPAPAAGAPASNGATGQSVAVGPTLFNQLISQGLTEKDIERKGADIYVLPSSRFYGQAGGSASGAGAPGASSGSPEAGAGSGANAGTSTIDPADRGWVNSLYKKYFDRDATSSELGNWAKESPQALEQFLGAEAKKYGYTSAYFKDDSNKRLEEALNIINGSNLPPDIKTLWAAAVKSYPSGMEYNVPEVLSTFNQIKQDTIDPKFRELADIAVKDFTRASDMQKAQYEQNQEQVRSISGQNIRQAKEGLEQSGMTFTGKAIQELGANSAFAQPGQTPTAVIPNQEAFGGLFHEGQVNQQNRLMATSASLQNRSTMDTLNSSLEKQLGSDAAANAGATVTGGVSGVLNEQKQGQYAQSLSQIVDNYRKKQELNTNITK